jgi:hypothetical protein
MAEPGTPGARWETVEFVAKAVVFTVSPGSILCQMQEFTGMNRACTKKKLTPVSFSSAWVDLCYFIMLNFKGRLHSIPQLTQEFPTLPTLYWKKSAEIIVLFGRLKLMTG